LGKISLPESYIEQLTSHLNSIFHFESYDMLQAYEAMFAFSYVFRNGGHLGWEPMSSDTILKADHIRTFPPRFGRDWPSSYRGRFFNSFFAEFSIFSNSGHLGWWPGSSNTFLKGDHLRTIPPKFGPKWQRSFRGEDFNLIFC
jgi:hypothetical protein